MGGPVHYPDAPKTGSLVRSKMQDVRQLPEICRSCRREIRTLERCVILSTHEEKRAGPWRWLLPATLPARTLRPQ